jgi:hypothetical protein
MRRYDSGPEWQGAGEDERYALASDSGSAPRALVWRRSLRVLGAKKSAIDTISPTTGPERSWRGPAESPRLNRLESKEQRVKGSNAHHEPPERRNGAGLSVSSVAGLPGLRHGKERAAWAPLRASSARETGRAARSDDRCRRAARRDAGAAKSIPRDGRILPATWHCLCSLGLCPSRHFPGISEEENGCAKSSRPSCSRS